jgi:hypothetical protein
MAELKSTSIIGLFNLSGATQDTSVVGNLWFNPTINKLQYSYFGGAWSAGGALTTSRYNLVGVGTQNAGLAFGGFAVPANRACTEEYNIIIQTCSL